MKSFTKIAALAAILSTATAGFAMEGGEGSFPNSVKETVQNHPVISAAVVAVPVVTYAVYKWFRGGNKATNITTANVVTVADDASKVKAALAQNEAQVKLLIERGNYKVLEERYGITKADVEAYNA